LLFLFSVGLVRVELVLHVRSFTADCFFIALDGCSFVDAEGSVGGETRKGRLLYVRSLLLLLLALLISISRRLVVHTEGLNDH